MNTPRELEQAIVNLPLSQREALLSAIEQSVSDEYGRLTDAEIAADIKMVEGLLEKYSLTQSQSDELQSRVDAAERGEANYFPWKQVQAEILAELCRNS